MSTPRHLSYGSSALTALALLLGLLSINVSAGEPKGEGAKPPALRTAIVTRGEVAATIDATGTVEPEEVVDVGAQVVGVVQKLGPDPRGKTDAGYKGKSIDFGSPVEEGAVLAQIDDAQYTAQVEQAKAGSMRAEGELALVAAKLKLAEAAWQRSQVLAKTKAISADELDSAQYNCEAAKAAVAVAEAGVAQSKAALKQAEINLGYTTIKSPIRGLVIDRRINVGQTVVASLNAPSLFLIAKDLKRMQVWVSVNEADIGAIHEKQPVRFTVDAYPGKVFAGTVAQIRLNATMTQNVVTYTVVVTADNPGGQLLPYLTANVQCEVARHKDVLLAPSAALRWRPQPQWIAPDIAAKAPPDAPKSAGREGRPGEKSPQARQQRHTVWVQDGKLVRPIDVQIGLSDATMTEITGGDLSEGMEVIVGGGIPATDAGQTSATRQPSVVSQLLWRVLVPSESKKAVQKALASMGTNLLLVQSGSASSGGVTFGSGSVPTLTAQDADEIARQCSAVKHAAPIVRVRAQVVYGDRNWVPMYIQGTTPAFLSVRDWEEMAEGEAFGERDVRNAAKVCLIGETLKRELFAGESPLGKEIRIQNVPFRVVGVLSRKGANVMGLDQDDIVLAPWTTVKYRVSSATPADAPQPVRSTNVDQILVKAASAEEIPQATQQITEVLRERHRIRPGQGDDFNIRDMTELLKALAPYRG